MAAKSAAVQEVEKAIKAVDAFDASVKEMTLDQMNKAPLKETEPQTKLSQEEIRKSADIYLKPKRSISCSPKDRFNEDYRSEYNFKKEYVQFIAEHKEIIGETINIWTRPYGGLPAEEWEVPTNKPVWGPRYLAENIADRKYHRLIMQQNISVGGDHAGQYYGQMAADTTIQRLDARPVSQKRSVFMSGF